jgi:hypothetical protein
LTCAIRFVSGVPAVSAAMNSANESTNPTCYSAASPRICSAVFDNEVNIRILTAWISILTAWKRILTGWERILTGWKRILTA